MKNGTNPQPSQRADAPGSFLCYRAPHALTHYTDLINVDTTRSGTFTTSLVDPDSDSDELPDKDALVEAESLVDVEVLSD